MRTETNKIPFIMLQQQYITENVLGKSFNSEQYYENITVDFMFLGINMFWVILRLITAEAIWQGVRT